MADTCQECGATDADGALCEECRGRTVPANTDRAHVRAISFAMGGEDLPNQSVVTGHVCDWKPYPRGGRICATQGCLDPAALKAAKKH